MLEADGSDGGHGEGERQPLHEPTCRRRCCQVAPAPVVRAAQLALHRAEARLEGKEEQYTLPDHASGAPPLAALSRPTHAVTRNSSPPVSFSRSYTPTVACSSRPPHEAWRQRLRKGASGSLPCSAKWKKHDRASGRLIGLLAKATMLAVETRAHLHLH
jgi:hypothetical protein